MRDLPCNSRLQPDQLVLWGRVSLGTVLVMEVVWAKEKVYVEEYYKYEKSGRSGADLGCSLRFWLAR